MKSHPSRNKTISFTGVLLTLLIWASSISPIKGQITIAEFTIDTLSLTINDKLVGLQRLSNDTFRATVHEDDVYTTFLFNAKTKQVASPIQRFEKSFYDDDLLVSSFATQPSNGEMMQDLFYLCRGVYHGPYFIKDKEFGQFTEGQLSDTATILKTSRYGWEGTVMYHQGIKHGREECTNGRYTNIYDYQNGKVYRMRVRHGDVLMRDEYYYPVKKLKTYDYNGDLNRLQVEDSIHLYYVNKVLQYSLTFNEQKGLWESRSFYPSGKLERYRPHKSYKYSPLAENKWYSENGKPKPEPEPEIQMEEMMDYRTIESSLVQIRPSEVSDGELIDFDQTKAIISALDSVLNTTSLKIKKKHMGSYQFDLTVGANRLPSVFFYGYDEKREVIYQHVHYTLEALNNDELSTSMLGYNNIHFARAKVRLKVEKYSDKRPNVID